MGFHFYKAGIESGGGHSEKMEAVHRHPPSAAIIVEGPLCSLTRWGPSRLGARVADSGTQSVSTVAIPPEASNPSLVLTCFRKSLRLRRLGCLFAWLLFSCIFRPDLDPA